MERCAVYELISVNLDGVWKILEDKDFSEKSLILVKILRIIILPILLNNSNLVCNYSKELKPGQNITIFYIIIGSSRTEVLFRQRP